MGSTVIDLDQRREQQHQDDGKMEACVERPWEIIAKYDAPSLDGMHGLRCFAEQEGAYLAATLAVEFLLADDI